MEVRHKYGGVALNLNISYHPAYPAMDVTVILYKKDSSYMHRHKLDEWELGVVQVPPEHFPENSIVRGFMGSALYDSIVKEGYKIPKIKTAIGNKIVEKYDGDF